MIGSNNWSDYIFLLFTSAITLAIRGLFSVGSGKRFAICRVIAGKGSLSMDNIVHTVSQDEWFLLKPGMHVEFQTDMEAPVRYQIILFSCVTLTRRRNAWHTEAFDLL